jgi:hypothetical protein
MSLVKTIISMVALISSVASAMAMVSMFSSQTVSHSAQQIPLADAEEPDRPNILNQIVLEDGKVVESSVTELSLQEISDQDLPDVASEEKKRAIQNPIKEQEPEKIHPLLVSYLRELKSALRPDESMEVLISFRDKLKIPRFPSPNPAEPRDSAHNKLAMARANQLVNAVNAVRADEYRRLRAELRANYGCEVTETFWLINGVAAKMPLSTVETLAAREDLLYIEPRYSGEMPPQDPYPFNDVEDGRGRIDSDAYFNLGQTSGYIGLLDTGMRFSHTLFNNPSNVDFQFDCVNGGENCSTYTNPGFNPSDDCWNHGTSSGAIISGNGNLGFAFRGVTGITLDSFKVYTPGIACGAFGGLDTLAVVRGFQRAVNVGDRVIVAEMQGAGGPTSSISLVADAAFGAGAVIIAANGNASQVTAVGSPAVAHKVIGVGAVHVNNLATVYQINGPAPDGRVKPDIQAPTDTETASNVSDTALAIFNGTSGATPYAGGAAALARNFLRGANFNIDPGQVYAYLILSGQTFGFNNINGAGLIKMPTNGRVWFGNVSVGNGGVANIQMYVPAGNNRIDASIWWPESSSQSHNDIDLWLVDPSGQTPAVSVSVYSVFERVRVNMPIAPGYWILRVRGYRVPAGPQRVYYSAHARP